MLDFNLFHTLRRCQTQALIIAQALGVVDFYDIEFGVQLKEIYSKSMSLRNILSATIENRWITPIWNNVSTPLQNKGKQTFVIKPIPNSKNSESVRCHESIPSMHSLEHNALLPTVIGLYLPS